jgi:hypothetical protein
LLYDKAPHRVFGGRIAESFPFYGIAHRTCDRNKSETRNTGLQTEGAAEIRLRTNNYVSHKQLEETIDKTGLFILCGFELAS